MDTDIKEDKAWVTKFRNFAIILLVGFAISELVTVRCNNRSILSPTMLAWRLTKSLQ